MDALFNGDATRRDESFLFHRERLTALEEQKKTTHHLATDTHSLTRAERLAFLIRVACTGGGKKEIYYHQRKNNS